MKQIVGLSLLETNGHFRGSAPAAFVWVAFCLLLFQLTMHPIRIGADAAVAVQCAELALNGTVLYKDVLVLQAPMQIYCALIPTMFGQIFHLETIACYNFFVLILSILSLQLTLSVARQCYLGSKNSSEGSLVSPSQIGSTLIIAFAAANLILVFQWGEVQHLFALSMVPYFVLRWLRAQGKAPGLFYSILSGCLAAVGSNLTFYFPAIPIIWEALFLLWYRKWRVLGSAEVLSLLFFSLTYLTSLLCLPDVVRQTIYQLVLPLNVGQFFIFDPSLLYAANGVVRHSLIYSFALTAVATALVCRKMAVMVPLAILNTIGFSCFVLMGRGLSSDCIISIFSMMAIASLAMLALWTSMPIPYLERSRLALVCTCLLGLVCSRVTLFQTGQDVIRLLAVRGFPRMFYDYAPFADVISDLSGTKDRVTFLSTDDDPAYPAILQLHRKPGTFLLDGKPIRNLRLLELQTLLPPGLKISESVEKGLFDHLKSDIQRFKPELFIVQGRDLTASLTRFGIMDEITQNYTVAADQLFLDYACVGEDGKPPMEHAGRAENIDCWTLNSRISGPCVK